MRGFFTAAATGFALALTVFAPSASAQEEEPRWSIGVHSQWRRVQGILENEEAFRALEKIDRLAAFEEYIRHLEVQAEQDKLQTKEVQPLQIHFVALLLQQHLEEHQHRHPLL